jgi:hypothetical protein
MQANSDKALVYVKLGHYQSGNKKTLAYEMVKGNSGWKLDYGKVVNVEK